MFARIGPIALHAILLCLTAVSLLRGVAAQSSHEKVITKDVYTPENCKLKAAKGDQVQVHYRGTLIDGRKFDSSYDTMEPIKFVLGKHMVIPGWEYGIEGMCVQMKRKLVIPPAWGYGGRTMGAIPPDSTLFFDVELIGLEKPTGEADSFISHEEAEMRAKKKKSQVPKPGRRAMDMSNM